MLTRQFLFPSITKKQPENKLYCLLKVLPVPGKGELDNEMLEPQQLWLKVIVTGKAQPPSLKTAAQQLL